VVHPDDRPMIRDKLREAVRAAITRSNTAGRPSGGERWIHGRGEVVRDEAGRALRILGVNFDVTKRRRAEESLRESEARFRALADSAPALMWISGEDGVRIFVNLRLCRLRRRQTTTRPWCWTGARACTPTT
jgi:PAS domain-containing protein